MIVLGHRGGRGDGWPAENSLDAFRRAIDEGADGVELDVRLCACGEPVVLHDASLARVTNGADRRLVHRVRHLDLPKLAGGVEIARLDAALELFRGRIVNVEVKADAPRRLALARAVARTIGRFSDVDVVVSSFDPAIVLAFSALAPRVPRAMLVGARTPRLGTALPLAVRPVIVAAHLEDGIITERRVHRLRRAGLRVVAWTVNDSRRAAELEAMGVEWVITDHPARILGELGEERLA